MFYTRASKLLRLSSHFSETSLSAVPWRRQACVSKVSAQASPWLLRARSRNCSHSVPHEEEKVSETGTLRKDHWSIGRELGLWSSSPESPGSPLFTPSGSHLFLKLQALLRAQYVSYSFQEVVTPMIYKASLWKKSGHWEHYKDDMYAVNGRSDNDQKKEEDDYGLKPMNCPGHCLLFGTEQTYRTLPVRYADFSPLHRNEVSGSLSGLTRVRRFHQDDGHIFCRPDQVEREITLQLQMIKLIYNAVGLSNFEFRLSTRPVDFMGTVEEWDDAEKQLESALKGNGVSWELNAGDGAFYGPKIDVIVTDSTGKEHQTATIQLDFQLPQRFDLKYAASKTERGNRNVIFEKGDTVMARPVLIHRAVLGSIERFMALLTEAWQGKFPFWLSPRQLLIIAADQDPKTKQYINQILYTVGEDTEDHRRTLRPISKTPFTIELDCRTKPLRGRISQGHQKNFNMIAVVGADEAANSLVTVKVPKGGPSYHKIIQALKEVNAKYVDTDRFSLNVGQLDKLMIGLANGYA